MGEAHLWLLSSVIFVSGLLLLAAASIPLIKFYESADNIVIETDVKNNTLIICMHYNANVKITDYNLSVYYNNLILNSTSGEVLNPGSTVNVTIDLSDIKDLENIGIAFSGKIDGLYLVSIHLHR